MNLRNGLIISIVINVFLVALVFYVKKDAHQQAKDYVKPVLEQAKKFADQQNELRDNNAVLWDLYVQYMNQGTHDLSTLTKLAKEMRLPGKKDEAAFLSISAGTVEGQKTRVIGWEKRSMTFVFDAKDQFVAVNASDILEKMDVDVQLPQIEE